MCICMYLYVCVHIYIYTYTNIYMTCAPLPDVVVFLSLSTDIRLLLSMSAYHCFMSCYLFLSLYIFCTACRILAHWLMFFVLHTTRNKAYLILSYNQPTSRQISHNKTQQNMNTIDNYWDILYKELKFPEIPAHIHLVSHKHITCPLSIQAAHHTTYPDRQYLTKANWGWHPHQSLSPSTIPCTTPRLIQIHTHPRPDSVYVNLISP